MTEAIKMIYITLWGCGCICERGELVGLGAEIMNRDKSQLSNFVAL